LAGQGKLLRDNQQIQGTAERYHDEGLRIVFTNGCFDILHRGHITYLERAKALGDVLIVGLNSDASVQKLKGLDRPVTALADRIAVVAALGCVDHVLSFDDDTAHAPIRLVRPDLFVKGGDYAAKALPEVTLVEELGGRVRLLEYIDNNSTSGLIERIRRDARVG
jgi:D-beta-D-heptose 7-phosphate kinase/D-beta-D-heptose 1-phosphate adenosyltransferase